MKLLCHLDMHKRTCYYCKTRTKHPSQPRSILTLDLTDKPARSHALRTQEQLYADYANNPIGVSSHAMSDYRYPIYDPFFRYVPPKPKTLAQKVADLEAENKRLKSERDSLRDLKNSLRDLTFVQRYGSSGYTAGTISALEYTLNTERENNKIVRDQRDTAVRALNEKDRQLRAARVQRDDAEQRLSRARKALDPKAV